VALRQRRIPMASVPAGGLDSNNQGGVSPERQYVVPRAGLVSSQLVYRTQPLGIAPSPTPTASFPGGHGALKYMCS